MKIKMLDDADHRVSSKISQSFKKDAEIDVPAKTGNALIDRGKAEKIDTRKTEQKEA